MNNEKKDFDEFINYNLDDKFEKYKQIQDIFNNPYNMPEFDPIRVEICKCLINGLDIAAITTTNFLVEHFLKTALIYKFSLEKHKDNNFQGQIPIDEYFQEGHIKYNSIQLCDSIEESFKKGIITEADKNQLHIQRKFLRNAYGHADKNKIFGFTQIPGQIVDIGGNTSEINVPKQFDIVNLPFIQGIMLKKHAESNALPYFKFVDFLIRKTTTILFPKTTEKTNPQEEA
jgi:hypothetical protein